MADISTLADHLAQTPDTGRIIRKTTTTGSGADTRTSTEWYLPSGAVDHVDETQGATTRTVTNTYDAVGRVKTQTVAGSPASTLTYTYNQAGNVIQVDYPAVGGQTAKTAKTWWNFVGVPTHLTLPNGSYWRLGHDQAGRLTGVDLAFGAWVPVGAYTLDGNGQPLVETLNSGSGGMTRTTTRRPATGQAAQVNQVVDLKTCTWALTNDSVGRIKTITQTSATNQTCDQPGQTTTYGYDAASQLVSAANTGTVPDGRPKSWTYTYGNTGNRLTETAVRKGTGGGADTTTTTASRYNAGRLCATGATLPGSCNTASGVTTYGYDTAGRRTTLTRPTGQVSMTYAYDPGGRLATTTATPIGGGTDTVARTYDPAGSLASLNRANGSTSDTIVNWWDHTGFTPVPQITTTLTNTTGMQLSYGYERITSTGNWFAYDPLGSVLPTSTYTVAPNEYDPYGTPANQNPYSALQYFGYRGEITYADTIHLRHRDYDTRTGTLTTRDPLDGVDGTPTVANPYHYADNDPLNTTDPLGLRPRDQHCGFTESVVEAYIGGTGGVDGSRDRPVPCSTVDLSPPSDSEGSVVEDANEESALPPGGRHRGHSTRCADTDPPSRSVNAWYRRTPSGAQAPTYLRCGDYFGGRSGWGLRHIEGRGHFGGIMTVRATLYVGDALIDRRSSREINPVTRNEIHELGLAHRDMSGRIDQDCRIVVVVNPRTNGIVTAFMSPIQCDRRVW